jgi:hypothetical protein
MDPYLENAALWPGVHLRLIATAADFLVPRLRPAYVVAIEERVYISDERDPGWQAIIPDLSVIELPEHASRLVTEGGVAVEVAEPIVMQTLLDHEVHEARLEILDAQSRTVVTVIEVLSPSNKIEGALGEQSYSDKRIEITNSPCHLVEIDLLRSGRSFVPAQAWNKGDYFAHASRSGKKRPHGLVWPIRLHQRLPVVRVPLKGEEEEILLDLQGVLTSVYDRGGYDLMVDYRNEPKPPLSPEQQVWAGKLLKEKGLR